MENQHYLLSQVARILRLKPHQSVYSLSTQQVPDPTLRVANKRIFLTEDVERLAGHFHVTPQWGFGESTALKRPFEVIRSNDGVHEVRDCEKEVFAQCGDRGKALLIAGLLESAFRN